MLEYHSVIEVFFQITKMLQNIILVWVLSSLLKYSVIEAFFKNNTNNKE